MSIKAVSVLSKYRGHAASAGHGGTRLSIYEYAEKDLIELCQKWQSTLDAARNKKHFNNPAAEHAKELLKECTAALQAILHAPGKTQCSVLAKRNHEITGLAIWMSKRENDGNPNISFLLRAPEGLTSAALQQRTPREDGSKPLGIAAVFIDYIGNGHDFFSINTPSPGLERMVDRYTTPYKSPGPEHKYYKLTHGLQDGKMTPLSLATSTP